jgi:hypothetical protein
MLEFKFTRFLSAAVVMAIAGTLVAGKVLASTQSQACVVWDVEVDKGGKLTLHCTNDDNNYVSAVGTSGCGATTVDTVKLFHAQAMAAMLSRTTTYVWYSACSSGEKSIDGFLAAHP